MTGATLSPQNGVLFTDDFEEFPLTSSSLATVQAQPDTPESQQASPPVVVVRPFAWTDIDKDHREWLRSRTEDIQGLAYRTACDLIRIGQILAEIHERIPAGNFRPWLLAVLPWSRTQVYRLIGIGQLFGEYISVREVERIHPTAMYMLARWEVPTAAREHALEMAMCKTVGVDDARSIISQHKSARKAVPEPTRGEMRTYERTKKAVGIEMDKPAAAVVAESSPELLAWAALEKLVRQHDCVHISKIDDSEPNPDERAPASVRCLGGDRSQGITSQSGVGVRLIDVILKLANMEPRKTCQGACKRTLDASKFSASKSAADGRNRCCLDCERQRVKAYDERKACQKRSGPVATMGENMDVLKN